MCSSDLSHGLGAVVQALLQDLLVGRAQPDGQGVEDSCMLSSRPVLYVSFFFVVTVIGRDAIVESVLCEHKAICSIGKSLRRYIILDSSVISGFMVDTENFSTTPLYHNHYIFSSIWRTSSVFVV